MQWMSARKRSSVPRRVHLAHGGAVGVAQQQEGELLHTVEFGRLEHLVVEAVGGRVRGAAAGCMIESGNSTLGALGRVQARVVEAAAQVGVAVLEKAH